MRRVIPRRLAPGEEAPLVDHLGELRTRLLWCLIAVGAAFVVTFTFNDTIIGWLEQAARPGPEADDVRGRRAVHHDVHDQPSGRRWRSRCRSSSGSSGAFSRLPFTSTRSGSCSASPPSPRSLFLGGLFFAYFVALPASIDFLTNFNSDQFDIQLRAKDYYTFVLWVLIALSIVFELPIFVLTLARLGIVPSDKLRRNRRIGYVAVVALAVAMPGVDPVTLLFTAIPLLILFEGSIWMAVFFDRRWKRAAEAREAAFEAGE